MVTAPATAADEAPGPGFVGKIPVQNLWLLMLYASDLFRVLDETKRSDAEENPRDLPNLAAEILAHAVERRLRRRLGLGYRPRAADLNRVRGRIDMLRTERRRLLERGLVACRFEELAVDTPRNRYVRAALEAISGRAEAALAARCQALARRMEAMGVSARRPSWRAAAADASARRDAEERVALAAARLALELALPLETEGDRALPPPCREEKLVRQLFEKAVRGFYDVALSPKGWRVRRPRLDWRRDDESDEIERILPKMQTDIVLDRIGSRRRIVIDTKFTQMVRTGWYRDNTLTSAYIYQIYAYLGSQAGREDELANCAEGLLLHPAVGASVDEWFVTQGHRIGFRTVDLAAESGAIRAELLRAVRVADPRAAGA